MKRKRKWKTTETPSPAQTQVTEPAGLGEDIVTKTIESAQRLTFQQKQNCNLCIRRGHLFQVSQETSVTTKPLLWPRVVWRQPDMPVTGYKHMEIGTWSSVSPSQSVFSPETRKHRTLSFLFITIKNKSQFVVPE